MALTVPSWFKGRQGQTEEVGPNVYKLTAPNVPPAYITIRRGDNGHYAAALRMSPDGPDVDASGPKLDNEYEAWEQAFELYRDAVIQ
jgi:hypothetical protein